MNQPLQSNLNSASIGDLCTRALEHIENGIILLDSEQKVLFWNLWLERHSGINAKQAIGKRIEDIFEQAVADVVLQAVQGACEQGLSRLLSYQLHSYLLPLQTPDTLIPVCHSMVLRPLKQTNGMVLIQLHDITNAVRRERHLREKEQALRKVHKTQSAEKQFIDTVLETISALVVVTDSAGIIMKVNRSAELQMGFDDQELVGQPLKMLLGLDSFAHFSSNLPNIQESRSFTCRMTNVFDEAVDVRWTVKSVREQAEPIRYLIYTGQDITERERADALLRLEREMLEMTATNQQVDAILNHACLALERQLESCRVAVVEVESNSRLLIRNSPGLPESFSEQLSALSSDRLLRVMQSGLAHGQLQVFAVNPRGEYWQPWLTLAKQYKMAGCWLMPIQATSDMPQTLLAVFPRYSSQPNAHEQVMVQRIGQLTGLILERHQQQEKIKQLAMYDSLTGLANRSLLNEHLQHNIYRAQRDSQPFALLFIDLDGFKAVNDTHGHDAGDALLVTLAERLKKRFRSSDCCARIGGDEFVILLEEVGDNEVVLNIARALLTIISEPMAWGEYQLVVGASIGIALYPEDGDNAATLLTRADNAMYHAKANSKANKNGKGHVMRLTK